MRTAESRWAVMFLGAMLVWGCDDGNGSEDDTATDTTVEPDTTPDTTPDTPDDTGTDDGVEDPVEEDVGEEEEIPSGESLTILFEDEEEQPVAGVLVAARQGGVHFEAESDATGTAVLEGLDETGDAFDLTVVVEGVVSTWLGLGGTRAIPDPMVIGAYLDEDPTTVSIEGNITRSVADSKVNLTSCDYSMTTENDAYGFQVWANETDLPLSVFEYTVSGDVATIHGYEFLTYDAPTSGTAGPDVAPDSSATIHSATVDVLFDIAPDSDLHEIMLPSDFSSWPSRMYTAIQVSGRDTLGRWFLAGFTTEYDRATATDTDTVVVSWPQEAWDAASQPGALYSAIDEDAMYASQTGLPDDPASWSAITIHDLPVLPGVDQEVPIAFDESIPLIVPDTGSSWSQTFYGLLADVGYCIFGEFTDLWWVVATPEVTEFSFADLPLPSAVPLVSIIPPWADLNLVVQTFEMDADPWETGWNEDVDFYNPTYEGGHQLSQAIDCRWTVERP